MKLFIDFLGKHGWYRAASEPSWIDPAMPMAVLSAPAFLEASGQSVSAVRVYHVERGCFLEAGRVGEAGLKDLDTLVVVAADEQGRADPSVVQYPYRQRRLSQRAAIQGPAASPPS